jgi:hypothetical protein
MTPVSGLEVIPGGRAGGHRYLVLGSAPGRRTAVMTRGLTSRAAGRYMAIARIREGRDHG